MIKELNLLRIISSICFLLLLSPMVSFGQNHYEAPFKFNGNWVNSYIILLESTSWENVSEMIYREPNYVGELKKINFFKSPQKGDVVYFAPQGALSVLAQKSQQDEFHFLNWNQLKEVHNKRDQSRELSSISSSEAERVQVIYTNQQNFEMNNVIEEAASPKLISHVYAWESLPPVLPQSRRSVASVTQSDTVYEWESLDPVLPKDKKLETSTSNTSSTSKEVTKTIFDKSTGQWKSIQQRGLASEPVYEWESWDPVLPNQ